MRPPFQAPQPKLNKALISRLTILLTQAVECQNKGDNESAKNLYQQVVKLQPGNFECWHLLGIFEYQNQNYDEALKLFKKVVTINSRFAPVYSNIGLVLQDLKRHEEAVTSYDKAIELDPTLYAAYNNRGNALKDLGNLDQALVSYLKALVYLPSYPEALYNLAEIFKLMHRWSESLDYYNRAIYAHPSYAEAYNNRGLLLQSLNRVDEAIESFDQTIQIWPDYAPAHSNKSLALLLKGNYRQGWEEHEWRWRMKEFTSAQRNFQQPQWVGQGLLGAGNDVYSFSNSIPKDPNEVWVSSVKSSNDLQSKTILIHCEQGIGDTLQFCRYVPFVLKAGAQVLFEVQEPVFSLMKQIVPDHCLIKQGGAIPPFDYHCPLISLPYALRDTVGDIPVKQSYLRSELKYTEKWSDKLGKKSKPRIGFVWSGNVYHHNDFFRSISLEILLPYLLTLSQYFQCIGLQKELREGDQDILRKVPDWIDVSESIESFEDTAALCDLVDVIITVDTSVAHLAGAMGRPTLLMLPFAPDWRWLMDRADSPWYPSVKLYRQAAISDWKSVLDPIVQELTH